MCSVVKMSDGTGVHSIVLKRIEALLQKYVSLPIERGESMQV